jgi:hypothetical protein
MSVWATGSTTTGDLSARRRQSSAPQHIRTWAGASCSAIPSDKSSTARGQRCALAQAGSSYVTTVTPIPSRDAVDLVQLRRERQRIKDRVAQLSFLTVAVGFYVFLAVAAGTHP